MLGGNQAVLIGLLRGNAPIVSNASTYDFDCSSFTGPGPTTWADNDLGNGISSIDAGHWLMSGGSAYDIANTARRSGTPTYPSGDRAVTTYKIAPLVLPDFAEGRGDAIGFHFPIANYWFPFRIYNDTFLYLSSGGIWTQFGLGTQGVTGVSNFTIDLTGLLSPATAVGDIYWRDIKIAAGVDCLQNTAGAKGSTQYQQLSQIDDAPTYIEKVSELHAILIGDGIA